ncbi:MAG: uracil-DNA glycosylase family protein [Muribaculaceae bacterium]|nr:uracil-DNA glycosylase family protein [Muribaculaceae bacterium]
MLQNLDKTPYDGETHPFRPFIPQGAKLLMCGTFPPQPHRWSMNFYYPNYINDMWRIFGLIFFNDKNYFVDIDNKSFNLNLLKDTLERLKVALSDTGRCVVRTAGNAADKDLDIKEHIDLSAILTEMPECVAIATTGEKAAGVIAHITNSEIPKVGECIQINVIDSAGNMRQLSHWRMPSSSRAYPLAIDKKAAMYARMFKELNINL